jgi:hypothetical protein
VPDPWSPEEVAATVADYFAMLDLELRGESFNKAEHNRRLRELLHDRSPQAIEFKHANISAVLIELGLPYIDGYKPRGNYQELLRTEVVARLDRERLLVERIQTLVEASVTTPPERSSLHDVFVPPPRREIAPGITYERRQPPPRPQRVNYLEREARNASLGRAGEEFVMRVEHARLWEAGHRRLAERIEHVASTRGDGLGYDIVSFEPDGRERLIEVKTTNFGAMTPFFASANEVAVSDEVASRYHLYRLHKFRDAPRIFMLQGALREHCVLDATHFRVSLI